MCERVKGVSVVDLYLQLDVPSPIEETTWQQWFETWLTLLGVADPCELSLCLTTDEQIHALNAQFRQVDAPTDVLAFAAQETLLPAGIREVAFAGLLGDIVISVPTARVQATLHGHRLADELAWLATHGLLHLLGWDHPDDLALQRMLQQQRQMMRSIQLTQETHYGV